MEAAMLKNYLLTAVRNIKRNRIYSLINLTGLALGIAACLMILLHIRYELSFDRFHENRDRIFRVVMERVSPESTRYWGWNTPRASETMRADYPEVVSRARILTETGPTQIKHDHFGMIERKVLYTDPEFFEIFTVDVIAGDVLTFFDKPDAILLTRQSAKKYFGDADPLGKVLTVRNWWEEDAPHVVTGIIEDLPANSHFHFDFLLPLAATRVIDFEWGSWYCFNYVMLREGADWRALEAKLPGLVDRNFPSMFAGGEEEYRESLAQGNAYRYFLQPLTDIHLRSRIEHELEPVGSITYVVLFVVIAGFILILACVNFINLSTSRSVSRAREVGVRKVLGSFRRQLVGQFMLESILLTLLAMGAACGLTAAAAPAFQALTGVDFGVVPLNAALLIPGLLVFVVLIGAAAGGYPALFLSSFQPQSVLKGSGGGGLSKTLIRNVLVVFQFTVSIALITGTMLVRKQVNFMLNKNLGYDKANLLVIENTRTLGREIEAFKTELKKDPDISAAGGGHYPGIATHTFWVRARGKADAPTVNLYNIGGDFEYLDTLGIEVVAGRKYERSTRREDRLIMLNESAARSLGLSDPVGKQLERGEHPGFTIIGIVKDFHFRSLHNDIAPFAFLHQDNVDSISQCVVARIRPGSLAGLLPRVEEVWRRFTGGLALQVSILDETLAGWYSAEKRTGIVAGVFSSLAVLIGCLGLLGLAAYTTEQRTREVGIRKVLGAGVSSITFFFIKDFLRLVGIAFILAVPITYLVMRHWLRGFAYGIDPDAMVFLAAGGLTMIIACLTVGYQIIRAALADPVASLRYE